MVTKGWLKSMASQKVEARERDNGVQFQPVKDAVSPFKKGTFSGKAPDVTTEPWETQLHLLQLNKGKEHLTYDEGTKPQALDELEDTIKTVGDLHQKPTNVSISKQIAVKPIKGSRDQTKQVWGASFLGITSLSSKKDIGSVCEQYVTAINELDAAKQELRKIRQGYDASMEAKVAAFKQAKEAEEAEAAALDTASSSALMKVIQQVKLASAQTQVDKVEIFSGKNAQKPSCKARMEDSEKKSITSKNPEGLGANLVTTVSEIKSLQKDMESSKILDLDSVLARRQSHEASLKESEKKLITSKEQLNHEISEVNLVSVASEIKSSQNDTENSKFSDLDSVIAQKESYEARWEESGNKLTTAEKYLNPETSGGNLVSTFSETKSLQMDKKCSNPLGLTSVITVTSGLDDAKGSLYKVAEEEKSLKSLLVSLKVELENVKKQHLELKEKERETESIIDKLHVELCKSKSELKACLAVQSEARAVSDKMISTLQLSTLQQMSLETEIAKQEAEQMKKKWEDSKKKADSTTTSLEEVENKLKAALQEAEEAKLAEVEVVDQMKILSQRRTIPRVSASESGKRIIVAKKELEYLRQKAEELDRLADMKVAAAMAQVEAVKICENDALKKLEATHTEISDMKVALEKALRMAEKAEASKKAVEGKLSRWHAREQKKAVEVSAGMSEEMHFSFESSSSDYRIHKSPSEKTREARKWEKEHMSRTKKMLPPGTSNSKKILFDPSYLPTEQFV